MCMQTLICVHTKHKRTHTSIPLMSHTEGASLLPPLLNICPLLWELLSLVWALGRSTWSWHIKEGYLPTSGLCFLPEKWIFPHKANPGYMRLLLAPPAGECTLASLAWCRVGSWVSQGAELGRRQGDLDNRLWVSVKKVDFMWTSVLGTKLWQKYVLGLSMLGSVVWEIARSHVHKTVVQCVLTSQCTRMQYTLCRRTPSEGVDSVGNVW